MNRRHAHLPQSHALAFWFLAPALVLVFGLVAYPVTYDLVLALTDAQGFGGLGRFVGLANFGHLLADGAFWLAARNSLLYTLVTASLRVVLGVAMALALWRMRRVRAAAFLALFTTWVFPASLSAFAFYWLLSPPFHTFYTLPLLQVRWTLAAWLGEDVWHVATIALHDVWRSSAFLAIFLLAGLNSLSTDQLDYARLESTSWRRFRLAILPMLRRFLALAVLLSIVLSFVDFTAMYLQTGGRVSWPLLGTDAYQQSFIYGRTALGSAMTLIQLPVWLALVWLGFRFFEREPRGTGVREIESGTLAVMDRDALLLPTSSRTPPPRIAARRRQALGAALRAYARGPAVVVGSLAMIAFALFPIWWIFLQAIRPISEDRIGNPFWTWSPTLDGFEAALHGRLVGGWLVNTSIVLVVGIGLTLLASTLAGYALGRMHLRGSRWIARLLFASYFLPYPMLLVPVYQVFVWLHLDNTLLAVILLNQTLTIPFGTWLCFSYFQALPADAEEHARLDGSRWDVLRHIVLPMSWPVLIAVGIFAAGIIASDIIYAGLLLVHDDVKTIAVGLGLIGISLDEFDTITGGIGMAAAPLVLICAAFAPAYVRGLSAAMIEGA